MDRTHPYYELRQALYHRMYDPSTPLAGESKWYALPQFDKDYPALVYFHLHFRTTARAWRDPDHLMRLCWRENARLCSHSFIQFARGGWMQVGTYGCALRGPPRMLMRQLVCMNLHPKFAVKDIAPDSDFAIFNRLAPGWVREQEGIEIGFCERPEWKSKLDGTSPYDPLPAFTGFK